MSEKFFGGEGIKSTIEKLTPRGIRLAFLALTLGSVFSNGVKAGEENGGEKLAGMVKSYASETQKSSSESGSGMGDIVKQQEEEFEASHIKFTDEDVDKFVEEMRAADAKLKEERVVRRRARNERRNEAEKTTEKDEKINLESLTEDEKNFCLLRAEQRHVSFRRDILSQRIALAIKAGENLVDMQEKLVDLDDQLKAIAGKIDTLLQSGKLRDEVSGKDDPNTPYDLAEALTGK